jgi:hypothetical protein
MKYSVIFIDDFNKYTYLLFLRQKNEAFLTFIKFGATIETTIGRKIKVLQNDQGGVFYLRNFKTFWTKMAYLNNLFKQICFTSTMLQKEKMHVDGKGKIHD